MSSFVHTRFAPSPTGSLHLGSARTAYFNWLYAKHCQGKFLLRIEDTDQERSTPEAVQEVFSALNWLGLIADEAPVIQSSRKKRHQDIAYQLLQEGKAYYCYATPEELEAMKQKAMENKSPVFYDRSWRETTTPREGVKPCVRLKAPLLGELVLEDQVQGHLKLQAAQMDDFVILRSDETPTYMLAVVVDDHDMGITHIIRGDDHLTNAFRQMCLYNALGWSVPIMAHLPLIHGQTGGKLSKRDGASSVEDLKAEGFLKEAVLNTLLRLGWSHGNDEKISIEQAISWFDFKGLGKASARFDKNKLLFLNAHYLKQKSATEVFEMLREDFLSKEQKEKLPAARALKLLPELQKRCQTLVEIAHELFIYQNQEWMSFEWSAEEKNILQNIIVFLEKCVSFDEENFEESFKAFFIQKEIKLADAAKVLRVALTGKSISPSVFVILQALEKEESLKRLKKAMGGA